MSLAKNNFSIELIEYYDIEEGQLYENPYGRPSSAFAVINVNGQFLLGFNKYRNQWEAPAGKIEAGESAREAAKRELLEETHQRIEKLEFCGMFKIYDGNRDEYRFRAVFYGTADGLGDFIPNHEDEMERICLWDFGDTSIYVDEVDCKMIEMSVGKKVLIGGAGKNHDTCGRFDG